MNLALVHKLTAAFYLLSCQQDTTASEMFDGIFSTCQEFTLFFAIFDFDPKQTVTLILLNQYSTTHPEETQTAAVYVSS